MCSNIFILPFQKLEDIAIFFPSLRQAVLELALYVAQAGFSFLPHLPWRVGIIRENHHTPLAAALLFPVVTVEKFEDCQMLAKKFFLSLWTFEGSSLF